MKTASVADVKMHLSAYLRDEDAGPVLITRNGRAVGALIATEDEDELERLVLAYSPTLRSVLDKARKQFRAGRGIPHDRFWREVIGRPRKGGVVARRNGSKTI
jgi:antitoxin (DNA-binding transcriptional repressor) of toxin-antitoxin stability system